MSDTVIKVERLSKLYRLGLKEQLPETLMGAALSWLKSPFTNYRALRGLRDFSEAEKNPTAETREAVQGALHDTAQDSSDERRATNNEQRTTSDEQRATNNDLLWALRDVSFEVKRGEVLGIIGRNGAGKSTLLKILSGITEATSGRAEIHGRVASLLEVGTGFHPDLTGRENIYLNGTILGMTRKEITSKFDEIVDFSGIERFIDTPVKRYSSGMYVRLAFSVAAHLEPEVLLVDEVLAVGDAEFQKKCLGKMGDITKTGRTVIFVSHNMAAIRSLCKRALLIDNGQVQNTGEADSVVRQYLGRFDEVVGQNLSERNDREGSGDVRLVSHTVNSVPNALAVTIQSGDSLDIALRFDVKQPVLGMATHIGIYDDGGIQLIHLCSRDYGVRLDVHPPSGSIACRVPRVPLAPGRYRVNFALVGNMTALDRVQNAMRLDVVPGDFYGTGHAKTLSFGRFLVDQEWESGRRIQADAL